MAESKAKLQEMAERDHERIMLEEAKNKYESMIYHIRNKMSDDEEAIAIVSTEEQRSTVLKNAEDAEEWMYDDGYTAGLETYNAKYQELAGPAEAIFFRLSESKTRPEAIKELNEKLVKIEVRKSPPVPFSPFCVSSPSHDRAKYFYFNIIGTYDKMGNFKAAGYRRGQSKCGRKG